MPATTLPLTFSLSMPCFSSVFFIGGPSLWSDNQTMLFFFPIYRIIISANLSSILQSKEGVFSLHRHGEHLKEWRFVLVGSEVLQELSAFNPAKYSCCCHNAFSTQSMAYRIYYQFVHVEVINTYEFCSYTKAMELDKSPPTRTAYEGLNWALF